MDAFVMHNLGNRTGNQTMDGTTVNFTVQSSTNRYTSIGGIIISHDLAGNTTQDKDDYTYFYDYENRIVKIADSASAEVATFDYDALGRRIKVVDSKASSTTLYYYNPEWQVLAEYDVAGAQQRYGEHMSKMTLHSSGLFSGWSASGCIGYPEIACFAFLASRKNARSLCEDSFGQALLVVGNYIDEPLVMHRESDSEDYYLGGDHLYLTVVLIDDGGGGVYNRRVDDA